MRHDLALYSCCFIGLIALESGCISVKNRKLSSWLDSQGIWEKHSAGKPYSINIDDHVLRNQAPSMRFEVRPDDAWVNHWQKTFRAEVSTEAYPPLGPTQWYSCSLFIPQEFPIEDNRLILFQWRARQRQSLVSAPAAPLWLSDIDKADFLRQFDIVLSE